MLKKSIGVVLFCKESSQNTQISTSRKSYRIGAIDDLLRINNAYPWCHILSDRCLPAGRRLAAYIAHVSNIYSDAAARANTYVDDRNH